MREIGSLPEVLQKNRPSVGISRTGEVILPEERYYSWLENYLEWLADKEAPAGYLALLQRELSSLKG